MREGEQYVTQAYRNGLITQAQHAALRRHARHHSRTHMYMMLRLTTRDKMPLPAAHREAMRLVGK